MFGHLFVMIIISSGLETNRRLHLKPFKFFALTCYYEVNVAQCTGYRVTTPSAFILLPYKIRFHYAILSAAGHNIW